MITISSRAAGLALAASLLFAGAAYAQTTATPASPATPAPAAKATKTAKPRSAASIECSKEADAKGLHGKKARGPFMKQCKKDKAAAAGTAAPASK